MLRHRLDRQIETPLARIFGEQAAIAGMDARHHRRLVVRELRVIGQVLRIFPVEISGARRRDQKGDRADAEEEAEEAKDDSHPSPSVI